MYAGTFNCTFVLEPRYGNLTLPESLPFPPFFWRKAYIIVLDACESQSEHAYFILTCRQDPRARMLTKHNRLVYLVV